MPYSIKYLFFVTDLVLLNLSVLVALNSADNQFWINDRADAAYLLVYSNLSWFFLVLVSAPYHITRGWPVSKIVKSQMAFVFIHVLVVISLISLFNKSYSLAQIAIIYLIFIPAFFACRIGFLYMRKVFTNEIAFKNYAILGRNQLADQVRKYYLLNPGERMKFKGYLEGEAPLNLEEIRKRCAEWEIHEILCCTVQLKDDQLKELIDFGLDSLIKVRVMFDVPTSNSVAIQLEKFEKLPGFSLATVALDVPRHRLIKRTFDIFFSALFSVLVLSWLIPVVALLIRFTSVGPVFFVQLRSGENNRPFKCLKFRTMVENNDANMAQATKNDPRITRLGHILRKTSIDELPQFINVLIGDMSVVGPRPHMLRHTEDYSKLIEKFMGRQYVKPGITGLAQCMGYRGETRTLSDMENRVRLDRYYIENWTFWLDIKIIFLTVVSLIRGSDKAY